MFTKLALLSALALAGLATLVVASPIRLLVSAPPIVSDALAPRHHHGTHGVAHDVATTVDHVAGDAVDNAVTGGIVDNARGGIVPTGVLALRELASLAASAPAPAPDALVPREHQDRASGTLTARCFGVLLRLYRGRGRRPGLPAGPPTNGTSPVSPAGPGPSSPVMPLPGTIEKRNSDSEPAESDDEVLSSFEPAEECDCCKDKPVLEGSLISGGLISGLSGEGDIGLDSDDVPEGGI